jgi:hypothetical protein
MRRPLTTDENSVDSWLMYTVAVELVVVNVVVNGSHELLPTGVSPTRQPPVL